MKAKKFIRSGPHLPVHNLKATFEYHRDVLGFYDEWTEGIRRDELQLLFAEDPDFTMAINDEKHRLPLMWF